MLPLITPIITMLMPIISFFFAAFRDFAFAATLPIAAADFRCHATRRRRHADDFRRLHFLLLLD